MTTNEWKTVCYEGTINNNKENSMGYINTIIAHYRLVDIGERNYRVRDLDNGQWIDPNVFGNKKEVTLETLIMVMWQEDNQQQEDVMDDTVQRVDRSEWSGFNMDTPAYETDVDGHTRYPEDWEDTTPCTQEFNDDLQGKFETFWNNVQNKIDSLMEVGQPWAYEKADSLEQWREEVALNPKEGQPNWLEWATEAGPNWSATGHSQVEENRDMAKTDYNDYYVEEDNNESINFKGKMPKDLFAVQEQQRKITRKARFNIGKFMTTIKSIAKSKGIENDVKDRMIAQEMHKAIIASHDKRWKVGNFSGFLNRTGYNFFRMQQGGFFLITPLLLRSITYWVTKREDIAYSWAMNGVVVWNNSSNRPAINKYSEKIGVLYDVKGHGKLQEYLKEECMSYYMGM